MRNLRFERMIEKSKLIKGRILIIFAIILSSIMALMFWREIEYNPIVMIYGLPAGLYLPVTLTILLFMTFKPQTQADKKSVS